MYIFTRRDVIPMSKSYCLSLWCFIDQIKICQINIKSLDWSMNFDQKPYNLQRNQVHIFWKSKISNKFLLEYNMPSSPRWYHCLKRAIFSHNIKIKLPFFTETFFKMERMDAYLYLKSPRQDHFLSQGKKSCEVFQRGVLK